jgi:uncharacterized membrane protein
MRSLVRFLGPVCLVAGGALLGEELATGSARLYLLVVVPVITGTTPLFLLALVFLVSGFLFLPLLFAGEASAELPRTSTATSNPNPGPTRSNSGGLILVGPIPIFFGAWRRNPPISYRWALLVGVVLALVAVLLLWGFAAL